MKQREEHSLQCAVQDALVRLEESSGPERLEAAFCFASDSVAFAGHFPGRPVLPGIAQIMAVALVAGKGAPPPVQSIKRCKFMRPVLPEEPLAVIVDCAPDGDGGVTAKAGLSVRGEPCAAMTLLLGKAGEDVMR